MFHKIYTSVFLLLSFSVRAQVMISGQVTDGHGEPQIGANVYLEDTYDGATTDIKGNYSFETYETGDANLIVTFVGFERKMRQILLDSSIQIDFQLKEAFNTMDAVTISAGAFEASDEKKVVVLKSLDIATTAGATADITGALNTLPGTQKVGESGRLFVRGGTAGETKIFVDGAEAANYYGPTTSGIPTRSRFSPFLFKGTFFSTGGYSAEYGQAMSSTLILNTKDVEPENKIDVSLMSVGLEADMTKSWGDQSLYANIGHINLNPYNKVIDQRINWEDATTSWSGTLAYKRKLKKGGLIKSLFAGNTSRMAFQKQTISTPSGMEDVALHNRNFFGTVSLLQPIGENDVLYVGASSTVDQETIHYNSTQVDQPSIFGHYKIKYNHELSPKSVLKGGAEIFTLDFQEDVTQESTSYDYHFDQLNPAAFLELDQHLNEYWVFRMGLRFNYDFLIESFSFSPRLSMAYKVNDWSQFSFATGKYVQSPQRDYLKINQHLVPEQAHHYILNYQQIKEGRIFRAESYLKSYDDLVKYDNKYQPETFTNHGNGYAYGLDVFWRDRTSFKNVDYWLSYSWMQTERDYRDFTELATPQFATAHNLSFVIKKFFPELKTQMGATYAFTSGRPYDNPNKEGINESRTKGYHDLSFNLAYLPTPKVIIYFSATNLLGLDQVFGYNYAYQPNDQGIYQSEAIRLPAKRFIFLGCFITIGAFNNQLQNL